MPQYLTQEDVQSYGPDLVDFAQRAAVHAVSPHLQHLEAQNQELQARLARESRYRLDSQVEAAIPNWRQLDQDPDWHRWLLGVDSLSGKVRQTLLNEAKNSGDAARCIHFFRSFFARPQSAVGGGAQAASGQTRSAPSGRIYSRADIQRLYEQHRRGAYRGREEAWQEQEADFYRAQKEGRVLDHPYQTK